MSLIKEKKQKSTLKSYNSSNLIYSSKFSFYKYYDINFNSLSLTSKFKVLSYFYNELIKLYTLIQNKESRKEK